MFSHKHFLNILAELYQNSGNRYMCSGVCVKVSAQCIFADIGSICNWWCVHDKWWLHLQNDCCTLCCRSVSEWKQLVTRLL